MDWSRFLDRARADTARRRREDLIDEQPAPGPAPAVDDTLHTYVTYVLCAHPEVAGLVALMPLHHTRRATRTAADGSLVPLGEQDRGRWEHRVDRRGSPDPAWALARDRLGGFQAQAAIAALHAGAPTAGETDWVQILGWYDELARLTDSPDVRLNLAVAVGEADGPRTGPAALATPDDSLPRHAAVAAYLPERDGALTTAAPPYAVS